MNRLGRIQTLFEYALTLPTEERSCALAERAEGDAVLVREVELLLAADAQPLSEFDRGAGALLERLSSEPPAEELCGQSFGLFAIEEHLSSGGMAHVYRATRTSEGTSRRVALKVLRPRLKTEAFVERFGKERELLASLEHERIVSFLDAGTLPDGRPFLAMEFVEGVPLTEWSGRVSLKRRIEICLQVLATVQYAHSKLILHRDLKPTNVLVTPAGVPKLLDFGVALILGEDEKSGRADEPLTPSYSSPEQLRGKPASVASDVYSLGVLIHEVLGARPSDSNTAFQKSALPKRLESVLRKARAPEPGDRYVSVDSFADDLRRFLRQEPVRAERLSSFQRGLLFAQRQRWPIAFAGSILIALVIGWIGAVLDRESAEIHASVGWGAHSQAKAAARIFENAMAGVDAGEEHDPTVYLESIVSDHLDELPEAETMVRLALARLYLERGDAERAGPHAERAYELAQITRGVGPGEVERAVKLRDRARALLRGRPRYSSSPP